MFVAELNDFLLQAGDAIDVGLNPQIASSHHHGICLGNDRIEIRNGFGFFNLGNDPRWRLCFVLCNDSAQEFQILYAADKT